MSEMNIDSLKIEIASNSEKAEKSIENLAASLGKLKSSLNGMGVGVANARSAVSALMPLKGLRATNIDKVVSHLERLSKVDLSNLNGMKSLLSLSNLNTKDTGLNSFVNSLARLSKESKNFKPDILDALFNSLSKLSSVSASAESLGKFVSSMATFIRYTDNMKATANAFPALADSLNKFFDAMSKTNISDNTVRMAEALATLSKNGKKVSSAMKEMAKSEQDAGKKTANLKDWLNYILDTLRKFSGTALSGLKNVVTHLMNMGKAKNNVSGLAVNLKTLLTTLVGFRGITGVFNWAKDLVSSGAELTEINHIVESVFGEDMVGYVQDWADAALESFGIASTAAKKYAGTMSAMFQASNVGMKDSNKMAMDLVELAGDLSAFYNIDTETAYNKLKSGMAGMVRPLRDLGIDLSVATLKEYALSQGIEKSYSAMSQGEKMMLRYKYLMQQTSTQQGDFQRTALSTANALRVLKAYASEITTQIGSGLNAALRHVIVGLNKFMKYILAAARAFATFMKTIFGDYKGGASGVNLDGALSDADDSADSLADSAESAAGGLGDADEAAKKLKKDLAVLPFDELNQLAKDQESTSSNAGTGTGGGDIGDLGDFGDLGDGLLGDAVDKIKGKLGELETFFDRWARLIKGYFNAKNWEGLGKALAWGINQGLDELYKLLDPKKAASAINSFLDPFITTFNSFVDAIHWDTLGGVIGRGVTILVNAFNRLLDPRTGINFTNIGKKLGVMLNNAIKNINWRGVGQLISNMFMVGWRVFKGFIDEFDAEEAGLALQNALAGAVEKLDPELIGHALGTAVTKIATFMKNAFSKKETWVELGTKLASGINAFLEDFDGQEVADGINAMLGAILTTIGSMLLSINYTDLLGAIGEFVAGLGWASIAATAVDNLIDGFQEAIGNFFDNIKETFSWERTEAIFAEANKAFEQGGIGMINGIGLGFLGAISFLLEPIQNVFDSVMQFFCDVFGITDVAENFLTIGEKIIGGIIKGTDDETPSLLDVIKGLPYKVFEAAGNALEWLKEKGSDAIKGIRDGWDSVLDSSLLNEVKQLGNNVFNAIGDILSTVKEKGSDIINGIRQGWDDVKDGNLFNMLEDFKDDVFDAIGDIFGKVKGKGEDIIDGMAKGYSSKIDNFLRTVGKLADRIKNKIGSLYDLGQDMIGDFADGLKSMVDFPSPHIDWDWNGAEIQIGDWIWTLPTFSVDWYAKGGLFTRPTLAGFGDAGDEAALPLENQATMNRIARAIVDNSDGAFGLSEEQLASAIARGYVQAMMSNQGNERPLNVYATLYTEDNEVLARAVQKGNQSMDFRNNATPQFG